MLDMDVSIEDSTSMACFYVCCIGVLKNQSGKVFPLNTFFKDWSFRRTPFAAYTDFSSTQRLLSDLDGICIKRVEASDVCEMLILERDMLSTQHYPICSVDSYYLSYHPYFNKIHMGHFVVLVNSNDTSVQWVDVELKHRQCAPISDWIRMRTHAEDRNHFDIFSIELKPVERLSPREELEMVCRNAIHNMLTPGSSDSGLYSLKRIGDDIAACNEQALSLFMNHYGMRTSRYQHGKYLYALAALLHSKALQDLSNKVQTLSVSWGRLHFICTKFQFSRQRGVFNKASFELTAIAEMESRILHEMRFLVI